MPKGVLNIGNRDRIRPFLPSPVAHFKRPINIISVSFKMKSIDQWYKRMLEQHNNIDIRNPEIYVNGRRPIDGIFSPLFGADTTQDAPVYSCDCRALTGGSNLGRWCDQCQSYVRTIEADLRMTGFIDIAPYHVLTFHGYRALSKVLKNLDEIITTTQKINKSGKVVDTDLPTIMDLYEDYDELYADKAGISRDIAFTSKIPAYSSRLRPLMQKGNRITLLDVNQLYMSVTEKSNIVQTATIMTPKKRSLEIQKTLNEIQGDFASIWKIVVDQCNGKAGVFRRAMASGRLDNSTREVIVLGPDLRPYEIDVPYRTMMTQYEEEIANYLSKQDDIPLAQAITMVEENTVKPHPKFVSIINNILRQGMGVWMLVNRNPTISKYGILYMKVRQIHDDMTGKDLTLHLPQDILALIAADFDGDQCTTISVKNPKYHPLFMNMNPCYAFINRSNGKYNTAMGLTKDYSAIISAGWDHDVAYDRYLNNPEEDSYDIVRRYGLVDPYDVESENLANQLTEEALARI